jgi:hypothetical protein
MSQRIKDHIGRMTKEEKWAEFRHYVTSVGILHLDVDQIKMDQAIVGAPDSALDDALVRIAQLCGSVLGQPPLTAQEFINGLKQEPGSVRQWLRRGAAVTPSNEPQFSMRKSANRDK